MSIACIDVIFHVEKNIILLFKNVIEISNAKKSISNWRYNTKTYYTSESCLISFYLNVSRHQMNGWNGGETIALVTRMTCSQENVRAYISVEITHYTYRGPGGLLKLLEAHRSSVWFTFARTVGALQGQGEGLSSTRRSSQPIGLVRQDGQIMILS